MPRNFDGANDSIHMSAGGLQSSTFGTFAIICKRNGTTFHNLMTGHTSGGTSRMGLEIEDNGSGNHLQLQYDGTFVSTGAGITIVNADGWVLLAAGKATGTTTPRGHKYVYSSNTWTHADFSGTATNWTSIGSTGTMRFGEWEGADDFNGDIAAAGYWSGRNLADAEVELLAVSLQGWFATAPDALWLFDQQSTTQNVVDLMGGGANQSALTGTTVSTNSLPIFGYGHEVVVLSSSAAAGGGTVNADAALSFTATRTAALANEITASTTAVSTTATRTAALATDIPLSGTAVSTTATRTAALATSIPLTATVSETVDRTAALATSIPLAGTAVTETVTRTAALANEIPLTANRSITATISGTIEAGSAVDAAVTVTASRTGELALAAGASGAVSVAATVTGAAETVGTRDVSAALNVAVTTTGAASVVSGAPAPAPAGGWRKLMSIMREAAGEAVREAHAPPVACPQCGEPLTSARGQLACRFDGWRQAFS